MRKYWTVVGTGTALMCLSGAPAQAVMAKDGGGVPPPGTGVKATPFAGTPHFAVTSKPVEQVRQLVQCGSTMYAVGSFSKIFQGGNGFTRSNIFSFRATPPFTMTSWAPRVRGAVNSITFNQANCSHAYIGGTFTRVNGTKARNIAEISTRSGRVVKSFKHRASDAVQTLLATNGHILVGGFYKTINGSSADPYMTSLNPNTGKDDGFVHLKIRGFEQFRGAFPNRTRVFNQALSHGGKFDLVMGDFTSVGGLPRQQIFMLRLDRHSAKVTGWRSPEFKGHCARDEPQYVRAASWSPNNATIYIADTGLKALNGLGNGHPQTGLCDAAVAFPATQASVKHKWINYTGCDGLYSTAADSGTAYFAGHERFSMNRLGCNHKGPGAIPAQGMEGLSPTTGTLYVNSHGTGYYSRARGYGADDMLLTKAGLWIADDNFANNGMCGGVMGLSGICFLPY